MPPTVLWHPYTHTTLDPPPIKLKRAEGVYLYTEDGRQLIDAISSWWVTLHGHAHPKIAAAIAEQAKVLEQVIFAGFTHEPAEELAARLGDILPASLRCIFFSDDGSTAVEVALKMAVQYWRNQGESRKTRIIALEHAYHGDTVGAMSVSAESSFTAAFKPMLFPVWRAHSAHCFRCPVGKTRDSCSIECADRLEELLEEHSDEVAAVIVEPLLQGAGGMIVHPLEFLQRIRELTNHYNVLLIADEVLTGFGRCGQMFACERAGIEPEIMCLSKGLTGGFMPLGATVTTRRIFETFSVPDRRYTLFHGHSYTANPLACAAAVANLEIFRREPVFERIASIEQTHREQLRRFAQHPAIGDARMIGTVAALELRASDAGYLSQLGPKFYVAFLKRGILLRPLGNVVYILPPYAITPGELEFIYSAIGEVLDLVA
ncbi:MAG TPA: adenosylmethionine--8-amino-7-oxononanoate transaminase [Terriglobia bacterium]|nr:adenosylmethionine--8-amino-7-oxononanoate transaminase [Terriglobia bacterium]